MAFMCVCGAGIFHLHLQVRYARVTALIPLPPGRPHRRIENARVCTVGCACVEVCACACVWKKNLTLRVCGATRTKNKDRRVRRVASRTPRTSQRRALGLCMTRAECAVEAGEPLAAQVT
ncbi:hypothetical protein EON67_05435 [archaeon]|nr:MAG: hypothetical protein EON67_05435 [archaeon]